MSVLITGGLGFVGLNIAQQILSQQGRVILFGPGTAPPAFVKAIQALPGQLEIVPGDISCREDLEKVLSDQKPEYIVNAAAITAGPEREITSAHDIFRVNLGGTIELLEACLRHSTKRLVQLGTGSVFGEAGQWSETLKEQSSAAMPESLYGISKFAAERTCMRYAAKRNLDVTVMRLGTVFGRWEYSSDVRDTLSIPLQLLKAAQLGEHAVVARDCANDWVYSVDVASGVLCALNAQNRPQSLYHLSSGQRWDIGQWCKKLAIDFPAFSYEIVDDRSLCTIGLNASPRRSLMSIDRITKDLGFKPKYFMEEAFSDFVRWGHVYLR